jgi:hypothetical protein
MNSSTTWLEADALSLMLIESIGHQSKQIKLCVQHQEKHQSQKKELARGRIGSYLEASG